MKIANITEKKGIMIGNGHPLYGPDRMQKHCILKRGRYTNATGPFPSRLHQMLLDADAQGNRSIVSWLPDGRAFRVNYGKKDEFVSKIMPIYFKHTSYKSFQRQLNLWGFSKPKGLGKGTITKGTIFHPLFIRGQPALCNQMERIKIKGKNATNGGGTSPSRLCPPEDKSRPPAAKKYKKNHDEEEEGESHHGLRNMQQLHHHQHHGAVLAAPGRGGPCDTRFILEQLSTQAQELIKPASCFLGFHLGFHQDQEELTRRASPPSHPLLGPPIISTSQSAYHHAAVDSLIHQAFLLDQHHLSMTTASLVRGEPRMASYLVPPYGGCSLLDTPNVRALFQNEIYFS